MRGTSSSPAHDGPIGRRGGARRAGAAAWRWALAAIARALAIALVASPAFGATATAARAPDPGGSEQAAIALPPADRWFGFNEDVPGAMDAGSFALLGRYIGANAVRTSLPWNVLEPARDVWNEPAWRRWRNTYEAMLSLDITPIFVLGFAPGWARPPGRPQLCAHPGLCTYPPARGEDHRWRRFVAEAVRRFPGAIFEVWNEPNLARFWQPRPDPERWAELMWIASDEIRRRSPGSTVLACGCATPLRPAEGRDELLPFMLRAARHLPGLHATFDGFSFHSYPQAFDGEPLRYGEGSNFAETFRQARQAMAAIGAPGRELWLTELGLWTFESPLDEVGQAIGMERLIRRTLTMHDVRAVLVHRARASGFEESREASFGLLSPGGVPRPLVERIARIAASGSQARPAISERSEP